MPTDGRVPDTSPLKLDGRGLWRPSSAERARLVCLVHPQRAGVLLPVLRGRFAREPLIEVLVERRAPAGLPRPADPCRATVHRAPVAERDAVLALPPELRHEASHLRLVQPLATLRRTHEGTDIGALVASTLAMDPHATSELWWRVSPRVLARLELTLGRTPDLRAARSVLGRILDALPTYDPASDSLTAWLDGVADGYAEDLAGFRAATRGTPAHHPAWSRRGVR
jgi:hypothetical protein